MRKWELRVMNENRTFSAQYQLRLPQDLRDRIRHYAERQGRSMNAEIVRVLEREYPRQPSMSESFSRLLSQIDVLRNSKSNNEVIKFVNDFHNTIEGMISGRVTNVDIETQEEIMNAWKDYKARVYEESVDIENSRYELDEVESMRITGAPEKYAIPPLKKKDFWQYNEQEFHIFKRGVEYGRNERNSENAVQLPLAARAGLGEDGERNNENAAQLPRAIEDPFE
jgi:hypothetical protein